MSTPTSGASCNSGGLLASAASDEIIEEQELESMEFKEFVRRVSVREVEKEEINDEETAFNTFVKRASKLDLNSELQNTKNVKHANNTSDSESGSGSDDSDDAEVESFDESEDIDMDNSEVLQALADLKKALPIEDSSSDSESSSDDEAEASDSDSDSDSEADDIVTIPEPIKTENMRRFEAFMRQVSSRGVTGEQDTPTLKKIKSTAQMLERRSLDSISQIRQHRRGSSYLDILQETRKT